MRGRKNPPLDLRVLPDAGPLTFDSMAVAYLQDYQLQRYRSLTTARARVEHLRSLFGGWTYDRITADAIRTYQLQRRQHGAEAATVNRETSALSRMFHLAVRRGQLERMPLFPKRLEENPPRQGFFEHTEYLTVRQHLPRAFRDVLDFAYYSGWRRNEILGLLWSEVDLNAGVIRLPPQRSKTRTGRVLPISPPLRTVLERRRTIDGTPEGLVFRRDGVAVRDWRTALRDACRKAKTPHRLLHDCRRTAARNLVRAGVPERIAMVLTGHKTRAIFDRYNIVDERELFLAGESLVSYLESAVAAARRRSSPSGRRLTAGVTRSRRTAPDEATTWAPRSAPHALTRAALYTLVWSEPVSTIAPRYGVSDRALAKICARHDVPVPPCGYWAKKRAGQCVAAPPLPVGHDETILVGRVPRLNDGLAEGASLQGPPMDPGDVPERTGVARRHHVAVRRRPRGEQPSGG